MRSKIIVPNRSDLMTVSGTIPSLKSHQKAGYRDGSALKNHINSAHKGKVEVGCPACKELIQKCSKEK